MMRDKLPEIIILLSILIVMIYAYIRMRKYRNFNPGDVSEEEAEEILNRLRREIYKEKI